MIQSWFFFRLVVFHWLPCSMTQNSCNLSWLVFASQYGVPMFVWHNLLVFSNHNGLDVQYCGCTLGMPSGTLVLCITQCVHDYEEAMVFSSSMFHEKMRDHMHFIPLGFHKCALLIVIPLYFCKYALLIVNVLFWWKPDDYDRNLMTQRDLLIEIWWWHKCEEWHTNLIFT